MHNRTDPIIAISTAPGKGAVGIVRISGSNLQKFISYISPTIIEDRKAKFLKLTDTDGLLIDEVILLYFRGPHSFTGEDILEIQGHGGPIVLQRIIKYCLKISKIIYASNNTELQVLPHLRIAYPGEYSERAFYNNKIDLIQAEAISDLIDASTEQASLGASRSLSGEFSKEINILLEEITRTRVFIEAYIDFPEEEIGEFELNQIKKRLLLEIDITNKLLNKTKNGLLLRDGINTVITGQPNAGKSSIMNELCNEEISIVTDIEGTTRDIVKQQLQIEGIPINLIDTAGINYKEEKINLVEKIGIEKAWKEIGKAEIIIFVHDITKSTEKSYIDNNNKILKLINENRNKYSKIIHVLNKADLINNQKDINEYQIDLNKFYDVETLVISIKNIKTLEQLKEKILLEIGWSTDSSENVHIARTRHLDSISKVKEHLCEAVNLLDNQILSLEFIAEELRLVQRALSEITGEFSTEDLLGEIFSKFCIGK
ncbi:MAG: tRNA uridine-5-carboxymethylaminomethyl(34) synthesis GTPase MnmE [bacterium]